MTIVITTAIIELIQHFLQECLKWVKIFNAVAYDSYDLDNMTYFATDVDKFHANCCNYSGAVITIHFTG